MKFGAVNTLEGIDLTLPEDPISNKNVLTKVSNEELEVYVACPNWNKEKLKGFYPKGVKDELTYYARQFNAIELNTSFYRLFEKEQFRIWKNKTPDHFCFLPKLPRQISHDNRLQNVDATVKLFAQNISVLDHQLGSSFLQLPEDFSPDEFIYLKEFIEKWPNKLPLAVELRDGDWFKNPIKKQLYKLLEENSISLIHTDTAGRRDLLHMKITVPWVFIRYVGTNDTTDYQRLDDWVDRLEKWHAQGIQKVYFCIHQHYEEELPLLSAHFIRKLNKRLGTKLVIPFMDGGQQSLF